MRRVPQRASRMWKMMRPTCWQISVRYRRDATDSNSDPTFDGAIYKLVERHCKQVEGQNAVKQSEEILKTDWRKAITLPNEYSAYSEK